MPHCITELLIWVSQGLHKLVHVSVLLRSQLVRWCVHGIAVLVAALFTVLELGESCCTWCVHGIAVLVAALFTVLELGESCCTWLQFGIAVMSLFSSSLVLQPCLQLGLLPLATLVHFTIMLLFGCSFEVWHG
ncbi:uncharacterized protein LOC127100830 isoform X2 [Lathyrus oleraceus]|uniref:uncharacterized protein LOC127100830 isoform X2 n=1 Tax=Pisum sativum TaxID=3888 RepID=UPI0021CF689E|nr:uncharacterized protein LOC127100830 isoform X2 [Pisum sativum]